MRIKIFVLSVVLFSTLLASAQARRSVWSGVYSSAQAERGKVLYEQTCMRCHAANLDGVHDANLLGDFAPRVSIRGADFMDRWREDTLHSLYTFIANGMPPRTDPTAQIPNLSRENFVDIVSYILQGNGFPTGQRELDFSDLRSVRIQEKDGARPLASFSRVQVVGCLTLFAPGQWQLSSGSEPMRIRELKDPAEEDVTAAQSEPLGNFEFDLQNIGYLGQKFNPVEYQGFKMLARGVLIRQPPAIRIDVRSLVQVAETCP